MINHRVKRERKGTICGYTFRAGVRLAKTIECLK
jgi:hypothetical protein